MKILVCGSRGWTDRKTIRAVLMDYIRDWPLDADEPVVMHGAARGADEIAGEEALDLGFWVEEYPADWESEPRRAGILRNLTMLNQEPDVVLAFQINGSRGTQHTIDEARRRGIPVMVFEERS